MLKKILKWLLIGVGSSLALVLVFYAVVHVQTQAGIDKVYTVKLQTLKIPDDSASYQLGKHVAEIRGCLGCHGADLGGGMPHLTGSPPIGVLYSANISSGKGGLSYTDQDWIRALRHGLGKDGRSLWFMPSQEVYRISNREMAALIGYLKKQPPVDRMVPAKSVKPLGRVLAFLGEFPLLPAERIDHDATYPDVMQPAIDAAYGEYLATSCTGCHLSTLKGANPHAPGEPPIPDISSTGKVGTWSEDGFVSLFHTGQTPEGRKLSKYMPIEDFKYSNDELKAIYAYLHQVE